MDEGDGAPQHETEQNGWCENKRVGPSNKWEVAKAYNYFFFL